MFMVILLLGWVGIVMLGAVGIAVAAVAAGIAVADVSIILLIWFHVKYKNGHIPNTTSIVTNANRNHHRLWLLIWFHVFNKRYEIGYIIKATITTGSMYHILQGSFAVKHMIPKNENIPKKPKLNETARAPFPAFCFSSGGIINTHPWNNRDMAMASTANELPYKAKSFDTIFNPPFYDLHNRGYQNLKIVSSFFRNYS
ncbi:MAG: hypothetical protein ABSA18_12170 [Dehalococcoidia bacterium]|jgi:hypothetical protein